jgi:Tat protein secretion system quality control protein TatD with DNase activity
MAIDSHMHINSIVLKDTNQYINEINNNKNIESVINVGLNIDTSNESLII